MYFEQFIILVRLRYHSPPQRLLLIPIKSLCGGECLDTENKVMDCDVILLCLSKQYLKSDKG